LTGTSRAIDENFNELNDEGEFSMRNRIALHGSLLCAALLLLVAFAAAQNPRVGTTSGVELVIPVGARDIALGGSTVATTHGVEALYWNPAGIVNLQGSTEAMFSTMSYIADITVDYAAVAGKLGDIGTAGLSVKSLNFGDIPLTTYADPDAIYGKTYSPSFLTVGLSFGRNLLENISVGGQLKIVGEKVPGASASSYAVDFGLQYVKLLDVQGLSMGVAIKNIGPQMKFDGPGFLVQAQRVSGANGPQKYLIPTASAELPTTYEIGLAYQRKINDNLSAALNGAFCNDGLYYDEYRTGLEVFYSMSNLKFTGRVGYQNAPQDGEYIYSTTFGLGVSYDLSGTLLALDYGYRTVKYFSGNQIVTLKIGL